MKGEKQTRSGKKTAAFNRRGKLLKRKRMYIRVGGSWQRFFGFCGIDFIVAVISNKRLAIIDDKRLESA